MNYRFGLDRLRRLLEQYAPDALVSFATLEARWLNNERNEQILGTSENIRNEHAQIIYALNSLSIAHCAIPFNDLCLGRPVPSPLSQASPGSGSVAAEPLQPLENQIDQGSRIKKAVEEESKVSIPDQLIGTGNRWAILVGVNRYDDAMNYGRLNVCVKDVEAVGKCLAVGGFDPERTHLLTDHTSALPTRDNILVTLKAVADNMESSDLLLFYYSGHGDEIGGESYLVARNGRRLVLRETAVQISHVKEIMMAAPAQAKIIILDACHSGANISGKGPKPMSEAFISRVFEQAAGLAILASCKQGQLSYEWKVRERSVFTHYLLEALEGLADRDEKHFVTVQDINRHVTNGVKLWASQNKVSQTPTLQYTVAGDIIVVRLIA